ncbi:MAG: hypothetical protein IJ196_04095 [Prevotella sp.]|nr:hypothetical protein [Prevotella sp.]
MSQYNDDTVLSAQGQEQNEKEYEVVSEVVQEKTEAQDWRKVTIGGIVAVMLAGGALVASAQNPQSKDEEADDEPKEIDHTGSHTGENGVEVAGVSDGMSFSQAFAAARAEVGPGGVFEWHGRLYNTFTAEEWDHMTPAQKADFAHQVQPEVAAHEHHAASTHHASAHTTHASATETHEHQAGTESHHEHSQHEQPQQQPTVTPVGQSHEGGEGETHLEGVFDYTTDNGQVWTVVKGTLHGKEIYAIDEDKDQKVDTVWIDSNKNHEMEAGEIKDASGTNMTISEVAGALQSGDQASEGANYVAYNQEDIGAGTPDYQNDVDFTV